MVRSHIITMISFIFCINVNAQTEPDYFIADTDNGKYLIYGTRFKINIPKNSCYEYIDGSNLSVGNNFIIINILDDMEVSAQKNRVNF